MLMCLSRRAASSCNSSADSMSTVVVRVGPRIAARSCRGGGTAIDRPRREGWRANASRGAGAEGCSVPWLQHTQHRLQACAPPSPPPPPLTHHPLTCISAVMLRTSAEGPAAWAAIAPKPSRSPVVVRRKEGRRRMLSGTSISSSVSCGVDTWRFRESRAEALGTARHAVHSACSTQGFAASARPLQ